VPPLNKHPHPLLNLNLAQNKHHFFHTDNQKALLSTMFSFLELFFSSFIAVTVAKENLLKTPAIVLLANFQCIQILGHPGLGLGLL